MPCMCVPAKLMHSRCAPGAVAWCSLRSRCLTSCAPAMPHSCSHPLAPAPRLHSPLQAVVSQEASVHHAWMGGAHVAGRRVWKGVGGTGDIGRNREGRRQRIVQRASRAKTESRATGHDARSKRQPAVQHASCRGCGATTSYDATRTPGPTVAPQPARRGNRHNRCQYGVPAVQAVHRRQGGEGEQRLAVRRHVEGRGGRGGEEEAGGGGQAAVAR